MKTKYIILLLLLCANLANTFAQDKGEDIIRGGLIKVAGNIGPGFLLKPSFTALYVSCDAEGYLNKRVSIRGDLSFYVGSPQRINHLAHNHSLFFGMSYHLPFKKLDPFIGLQPGVSIVQGYKDDGVTLATTNAVPVISAITGFHYYIGRFFHFYAAVRFVAGNYFREASTPIGMTEFRVMVGLGFNINVVKK